jgi:hypothetical protein
VAAAENERKRAALAAEKQIAQMIDTRDEMRTKIIRLQKQIAQTNGHESDSEVSSDGGTLTLNTTIAGDIGCGLVAEEKRKLSKKYRKKVTKLSRVSNNLFFAIGVPAIDSYVQKLECAQELVSQKNLKIDTLCADIDEMAAEVKLCYK